MRKWWRFGVASVLCGLLAGCGGGGSDGVSNTDPPDVPPPSASTRQVAMTVVDNDGRFVANASITVGASTNAVSTSARGTATVDVPSGSEQVLRIAKDGYAVQVQPITLAADETGRALRTMLVKREPPATIANIEAGGTATAKDGAKVEFPAAALVDAQGNAVIGSIDMLITPINPKTTDVRAFPGSFEGTVAGGDRVPIVTAGTVEFVPTRGGQKLNLAPGKTATIEMPLYATSLLDGTPLRLGDRVPFWSLNETTGVWTQEGDGVVVSSDASPTGRSVRGTISHFSWWNLDHVARRGQVCVTPTTASPPANQPANQPVLIEARMISGTGPTSTASRSVPFGARTCVPVAADGNLQFDASYDVGNQRCEGSATGSAPANGESNLSINMSCVTTPRPYFMQPTSEVLTNSRQPVTVEMRVDGETPDTVELLANGNVVASFASQFFYRHFFETSSYADGSVVALQARATKDGVQRLSAVTNVNIDRSPPTVVSLTPPTTEVVDRGTEFRLIFDEAVNAAPLTLDQVLGFSVRPVGQANFTPLAFTISQSTNGREVIVRINQELPVGTVSMSWGAFKDVAGNALNDAGNSTNTARFVSASWEVNRAQRLAGFNDWPSYRTITGRAIASVPGGPLMAVSRPLSSNDVVVSVYDAATDTWAPHPAGVLNDRPLGEGAYFAKTLAFDTAGVLHVLLAQPPASSTGGSELVLKKLENGAWVNVAPPLQSGNAIPGILAAREAVLRFDASNRPVVAVPYGLRLNVHRVDNGAWVQLGQFPVYSGYAMSLDIQADGTLVAFETGVPSIPTTRRLWAYRNGSWVQEGGLLAGSNQLARMLLQNDVPTVVEPVTGQAGTIDVHRFIAGAWQTERVVFAGVPEFDPGSTGGTPLAFDVAVFNGNLVFVAPFSGAARTGQFANAVYIARQLNGSWGSYDELTVAIPNDGAIERPRLEVVGNELFLLETDHIANRQVPYRLSLP